MGKSINVGIIGAGWMGKVHSEGYRRIPISFDLGGAEVHLRYAADVEAPLAKDLAGRYGYEKWTADWREVVRDKAVNLVDVCVPNFLHKEIVIEAARAGKHIICEKPLSNSPADSREMIEAVEKAGVKHRIDFNYRKVPAISYVKSMIESGELGSVSFYRAFIGQDWGYKAGATKTWRFESSQSGGGSLVTMGSHVIDIGRHFLGDVTEVMASSWTDPVRTKGPQVVDDAMALSLKFESGAIGSVISNWLAHGRKHHFEFEVNSEKASILFNSERLNELDAAFGSDEEAKQGFRTIYIGQPHPYGSDFELKTGMGIGIKESFLIQFYEFGRSILEDRPSGPNFYDGLFVDEVIEKAYRSVRSGQWEKIPKVSAKK